MSLSPTERGTAGPAPRFRTLADWLHWQETLHYPAIALGLDRCRTVAERLGLLPVPYTVITVGGTNGKGSCTAMLDLVLRRAGHRVGKYTSPHLLRYNERISVDGVEAADADLCRAFAEVDRARGDLTLTFFEFGTLAALLLFREAQIDVAVMEVGLGGRLDAVNILDADAALISTIDLDHENWLGPDRESIGAEKAGIFRRGRPAVCADPAPPESIARAARVAGAILYQAGRDFSFSDHGASWEWRCGGQTLLDLPPPGTMHASQMQNASGVLMVLHALRERCAVTRADIDAGLAQFRVPGRFQLVPGAVPVILDVAHNPQAARMLAANLGRLPCRGVTRIVLGMLRDKNHERFVAPLAPVAGAWYLTSLGGERGFGGHDLARVVESTGTGVPICVREPVAAALAAARAASAPGDRVVVTGSFLTVGAAMAALAISLQQEEAVHGKTA